MSTLSTYVASLSPNAYWKLDETSGTSAADSGPNSLTGTYTGTYTLGQSPMNYGPDGSEYALSLAGSGHVSVANSSYIVTNAAFSFFGIFKRTASTAGTLFHKGNTSVGGNQGVWVDTTAAGALQVNYFNGTWYTDALGISLPGDTISSVSFVYNGGTSVTTVVNGTSQSATLSVALPTSSQSLRIGCYWTGSASGLFTGKIDEVAWFGRALNSTETTGIHNAALISPIPIASFGGSSSLSIVAIALFDSTYDLSGTSLLTPETAERDFDGFSSSSFAAVTDQRDFSISSTAIFDAQYGFELFASSGSLWEPFMQSPMYSIFSVDTGALLESVLVSKANSQFTSICKGIFTPSLGYIKELSFSSNANSSCRFSSAKKVAVEYTVTSTSLASFIGSVLHDRTFSIDSSSVGTFVRGDILPADFDLSSTSSCSWYSTFLGPDIRESSFDSAGSSAIVFKRIAGHARAFSIDGDSVGDFYCIASVPGGFYTTSYSTTDWKAELAVVSLAEFSSLSNGEFYSGFSYEPISQVPNDVDMFYVKTKQNEIYVIAP